MPCGFLTCHGGFVHAMWVYDMSWLFCSCHVGSLHVIVILFMVFDYMLWCFPSCHDV